MGHPGDAVVVVALVPDAERPVALDGFGLGDVDLPREVLDVDLKADRRVRLPVSDVIFEAFGKVIPLHGGDDSYDGSRETVYPIVREGYMLSSPIGADHVPMADYTRRRILVGAGSVAAAIGLANVGGWAGRPAPASDGPAHDSTPPSLVSDERDTPYPLVTYNDHEGAYRPTMPVNVRFDLADTELDEAAVESVLRETPGWTRLVSVVDDVWPGESVDKPGAWDATGERVVEPRASYRRLVSLRGPTIGYHVYLWSVRVDGRLVGLAGSAHTDVGTASDHLGARYDEAADALSAPFLAAGWELEPATFAFGVEAGQRRHWGATGDRWLRPPPVT